MSLYFLFLIKFENQQIGVKSFLKKHDVFLINVCFAEFIFEQF